MRSFAWAWWLSRSLSMTDYIEYELTLEAEWAE
jgi:hypothetical protein